jgi:parallel beta-helix repeat protein
VEEGAVEKSIFGLLLIVLSLSILVPAFKVQPARAMPATIIVPDDYPTVQAAINAANPGDTVFVRNGVYEEHIEINKTITLTGESNQNTIILADSGSIGCGIYITGSNVTLQNFNITSGAGPLGAGIVSVGGSGYSDDSVRNNNIACASNVACDTLDISSDGNTVEGNQIFVRNETSSGIGVISSDNTVFNNTVIGGWTCIIVVVGDDNNVSDNLVSGQTLSGGFSDIGAIALLQTSTDSVVGNTLINNELGLSVAFGSGCSVYHNNFINNTQQALTENGSLVLFDNGYPSGGNFWSDYNGTDLYSGPFQNVTGSDGIGDTPYVIDTNNTDHYPLMQPFAQSQLAQGYVSVKEIATNNAWVYEGQTVNIWVTVINTEGFPENVWVALYYNSTTSKSINVYPIYLNAGQNYTLLFKWNTAGIPCQTYTLTAVATIPEGSNSLCNGTIAVRLIGDVNGDGRVNMKDIGTAAKAFGSHCANYDYLGEPASPNWNPSCDLNGDGKIDLRDIGIIARHFGQHYP